MIGALAVLFALQVNSQRVVPRVGASPTDQVIAAERQFFATWRAAWLASETDRRSSYYRIDTAPGRFSAAVEIRVDPRYADLLCYFGMRTPPTFVPDHAWGLAPSKRMIASAVNDEEFVCPNWLPPHDYYLSGPQLGDERFSVDSAIDRARQPAIRLARLGLIRRVIDEMHRDPRNNFVIGQVVRLLVDNGDLDRAASEARACVADGWWCRALTGFVQHRMGNIAVADAAFAESISRMSDSTRCAWTDISTLLDVDARRAYTGATCAVRDSIRDVTWWLADPLWSVEGNDRRTEDYARRMTIALRSAVSIDERYNWLPDAGGDAFAEMVTRYGWPAFAYSGVWDGRGGGVRFPPPKPPRYGYNQLYQPSPKTSPLPDPSDSARALRGRKTTYEYSLGRVHVVPPARLIADPFSATLADWSVNAPGGQWEYTFEWWPEEHYAPIHPFIGITDQQTAFLRRDSTTLLAYSTNLAQVDLARRLGDSVEGHLVVSTSPASIEDVTAKRVTTNDRLTFFEAVPAGKSLVSAEIPWDSAGHRGARARFGVDAPASLASMRPGQAAMSDPVLLVSPVDGVELPNVADAAIALMRGSTTMSASTNSIGIYWETYGFAATDSVDVAISVQRHGGGALVSTSWKEPQPGHSARTISGAIPIQMRAVTLGIPGMQPGDYTLEISVRKPGRDAVTSKRDFVLK